MIFFITSLSSATVIKINSLLKAYEEIYSTVPFFRFLNSTEGLGLDYFRQLWTRLLETDENSFQAFLNSSVVFYLQNDYTFKDIINPNYFNLLYKLILDSERIAIYSTEYEVFDELMIKVFGASKMGEGLYNLDDKNYRVTKNEEGIFINMEPTKNDFDENFLITGSTKNLIGKNETWDFFVSVEARTFVITFESNNYEGSNRSFNLTQLENKSFFGEAVAIELIDKMSFISYFKSFMLPLDEESEKALYFIKDLIEKDEIIAVSGRGITNDELFIFFESSIDREKIEIFAQERNLKKGKIGNYIFYQFTNENIGDLVFLYISDNEFIFSNVEPTKVNTYFSEIPRLKNTSYYKIIEEKEEVVNVFILNLSQYLAKNLYGSIDSFIVKQEYEKKVIILLKLKYDKKLQYFNF